MIWCKTGGTVSNMGGAEIKMRADGLKEDARALVGFGFRPVRFKWTEPVRWVYKKGESGFFHLLHKFLFLLFFFLGISLYLLSTFSFFFLSLFMNQNKTNKKDYLNLDPIGRRLSFMVLKGTDFDCWFLDLSVRLRVWVCWLLIWCWFWGLYWCWLVRICETKDGVGIDWIWLCWCWFRFEWLLCVCAATVVFMDLGWQCCLGRFGWDDCVIVNCLWMVCGYRCVC